MTKKKMKITGKNTLSRTQSKSKIRCNDGQNRLHLISLGTVLAIFFYYNAHSSVAVCSGRIGDGDEGWRIREWGSGGGGGRQVNTPIKRAHSVKRAVHSSVNEISRLKGPGKGIF